MKFWRDARTVFFGLITGLALAGVLPASAALWQWSKTAGTNATADPSINWAEGMSPSSVNDSARAMMARMAEYRDDISGLLTTGGTSTAYTVTTNQGLNSVPTDGQMLAFTPHATNGLAPTLRADGGTIYPLQSSPGTGAAAGVLIAGTPYTVKFSLASSAWILHGFYANPVNIPIGGIIDYAGGTVPNSNFAFANGQCISRATYAVLFSITGTVYGACDGVTTFGVPDLRERTVIGTDMGGGASGRVTVAGGNFDASIIGNAGGSQNITQTIAQLAAHTPAGSISLVTGSVASVTPTGTVNPSSYTPTGSVSTSINGQGAGMFSLQGSGFNTPATGSASYVFVTASSTFTGNAQGFSFTGNALPAQAFTGNAQTFTGTPVGSSSPMPTVPPAMALSKLIRIF